MLPALLAFLVSTKKEEAENENDRERSYEAAREAGRRDVLELLLSIQWAAENRGYVRGIEEGKRWVRSGNR